MTAADTYVNLRAFVDELVRCGLREACTSPGSRSTPLVLSLAREPRLRATSHLDERCGAFFALGLAKASGRPVALACTSGTAAANYAPAVIEAHEARVPLLVLTADRPPELRDVGAGQTIDQVKLYGSAAKWYVEIDDQPATPERVRWLRGLACRAYWTALGGRPGPVHVNVALREPLVHDGPLPAEEPGGGGRAGGRPWVNRTQRRGAPPGALIDGLAAELEQRPQAVLVAGRLERDQRAAADAGRLRRARRRPAAGRADLRRTPRARRDRPLRRPAARPGLGRRARAGAGAAGRRPADLQAAARVAGRAVAGDAAGGVRSRDGVAGPGRGRGHADRRRRGRRPRRAAGAAPAPAARPRLARALDAARPRGRRRDRRDARPRRAERAARGRGAGRPPAAERHAGRELVDARARRRDVLARARRAAARARQPRRQRDRRARLHRLRRRGGRRRPGRAPARRRRARARRRRPARRPPARARRS